MSAELSFELEPITLRVWKQMERDQAEAMLACPYYNGTGVCGGAASCGFTGEPACITDRPEGGWLGENRVADVERAHAEALAEDERWREREQETLQAEHIAAAGWPDW